MNKEQEIFKHSERRKRHELQRRKLIEGRLKAFNSKSIPSIFKKVEKVKRKPEFKRISWWQRIWNRIKLIFRLK